MMAISQELAGQDVSRETIERLEQFCATLLKWNAAINLIGRGTKQDIWSRHILDSVQLAPFLPQNPALWLDLGSGGGLPGLVLAIVAHDTAPGCKFHLVESDQRKSAFLREVSRQLSLDVQVSMIRIESLSPMGADVLSARALAPLDVLCDHANRHLAPGGTAIFPKGSTAADEIVAARRLWSFDLEEVPSKTNPAARILKLKNICHV